MRLFTTCKQKLQKDLKTVLQYQLIFGESLQCMHPSLSIEDMKTHIKDKIVVNTHHHHRYRSIQINTPMINKEDLLDIKEFGILKYCDQPDVQYTIGFPNNETGKREYEYYNNKSEFIDRIMEKIYFPARCSIRYTKVVCTDKIKRTISVGLSDPTINTTDYIKYLKNNYKTVLLYQTYNNVPLKSMIGLRSRTEHMNTEINNNLNPSVYKKIKFDSLFMMDLDKINNLSIEIFYNDFTEDGVHSGKLTSLDDVVDYINDHNLNDVEPKVTYHKNYNCGNSEYYTTIFIDYNDIPIKNIADKAICINEFETLDSFKDYTFCHGLNAYNHILTLEEKIKKLKEDKNMAICCTWEKEFIGDMGVYVKGDCKIASHFDLCTIYDKDNGKRFVLKENINESYKVKSPNQIIYSKAMNGEIVLTNVEIVGLWVVDRYVNDINKIEQLKELTGINEFKIVKRDDCWY